MTSRFDDYQFTYREAVETAISFVGQDLEFFTQLKVRHLLNLLRRHVGEPASLRALDVGCGVGMTDTLLRPRVGELHGVDIAEGALKAARARNPDVSYSSYDGRRLPYPDGSFDLSFIICVLHHVPLSYRSSLIRELARVTRPSGLVAVIEHNPLNPLTRRAVSRCEFDDNAILLSRRTAVRLLSQADLEEVESRYIVLFPWRSERLFEVERRLGQLPAGAQYLVAGRPRAR